eukprot:4134672-Ditylum_brightwellii.AAC.2
MIDWGIIFWRYELQEELPISNHNRRALCKADLKFQHTSSLDQLTIYVGAAHAMDIKSLRSIDGHVAVMAGAAIAYSTKWHQAVSASLT